VTTAPFQGLEPGAELVVPAHPSLGESETTSTYVTAEAVPVFVVCRFKTAEGKTFRQGHPTDDGGWAWNLEGVEPLLYRWDEVAAFLDAGSPGPLYIVEGEKDADRLRAWLHEHGRAGVVTTNPMGAGAWRPEYTDALRGARLVIVIADNDEPGRKHAHAIAAELRPHVDELVLLRPALDQAKADLSDHLDAGLTLDELVPLEEPGEADVARPARLWLRSAGDLLRRDDPGPTPFLVDELLVDRAIFALQGQGKVGKTWTILELARAIVTGSRAFGRFDVAEPGPVIVLLEESGETALHRRLDALMRGNGQAPDDFDALFYGANLGIKLDDPAWRERLVAAAVELRPRAVFLDPLVRMKGAGRDENVQLEIGVVLETIVEVREASGAACGFAHHTGHDGRHLRGSSDLEAFWESKLVVAKEDDGRRTVKSEHREAEAGPTWHYRLAWDGETRTVRLRGEDDPKRAEVEEELRKDPTASATAIYDKVGGRKKDVLELVKDVREQLSFEDSSEAGSGSREPAGTGKGGHPTAPGSPEGDTSRRDVPSGTGTGAGGSGAFPDPSEVERLLERHADIADDAGGRRQEGDPKR
jgi:hypothetical protein